MTINPHETDAETHVCWPDDLRDGIWPRSFALWMAILYLAMFIIRPWEKLIPQLGTIHFERICAIMMIVAAVSSGRFQFRLNFQTVTVFLFTAALWLSGVGVRGIVTPYIFLTLVVFYLILVAVIRSPYELLFTIIGYVATMSIYLAKAQWEFFLHGAGQTEMGVTRLQGIDLTFGNDNSLAASIVYSLPPLYLLYQIRHELCASWPTFWRTWFNRALLAYTLLAITSILLTRSRMGAIGLIAFLFLMAMRKEQLAGKLAGIAKIVVVCVGIFFVLPGDMQGRLSSMWTSADEDASAAELSARVSGESRLDGLLIGLEMFNEYPIFGIGVENYSGYRKSQARAAGESVDHLEMSDAHNLIGAILGETGLAGAVSLALLILAIWLNGRRARRLATIYCDPELDVLANLTRACSDVIILLIFLGQFSYNIQRFNWLWMAAFCLLASEFAFERVRRITEGQGRSQWV